jgi:hypothetical protein
MSTGRYHAEFLERVSRGYDLVYAELQKWTDRLPHIDYDDMVTGQGLASIRKWLEQDTEMVASRWARLSDLCRQEGHQKNVDVKDAVVVNPETNGLMIKE